MFLSIIVPVYKTEKFLAFCLDSLLSQNMDKSEYEIICVNDGSPDNSQKILEKYAAENNNITVLSQENAGPAKARNKGIAIAKGDYIWFVDSDDFIARNCLKTIKETIEEYLPENIIIGYRKVAEDCFSEGLIEPIKKIIIQDSESAGGSFYCWLHIAKREKLLSQYNKGLFDESIKYGEDTLYWRICYAQQTTKTIFLDCPIYYYRSNGDSLSFSLARNGALRQKRIDDIIKVITVLKEMLDKNIVTEKEKILYLKQCVNSSRIQLLMLLPQYGIDRKSTLSKLKDIKLYPFSPFKMRRALLKDVHGFKNKLSIFLRSFFGIIPIYSIFYKIKRKK